MFFLLTLVACALGLVAQYPFVIKEYEYRMEPLDPGVGIPYTQAIEHSVPTPGFLLTVSGEALAGAVWLWISIRRRKPT